MNFKQSLLSGKLADRVNEAVHGEVISSPDTLYNVLKPLMSQHEGNEAFYVIFLDSKNRSLMVKQMFQGTLTSCAVYPREIIKEALNVNAASLILGHNHPSGDTAPSTADIKITETIAAACHVMGIQLHEHIIVGDAGLTYSMAVHGEISTAKRKVQEVF